ncbi:2-desacetyl-2-hydroxyethyl bacteriochlorophyllide A dehydrogenase [Mesorhizobium robiniae]|uniref:2-desacetyl-2-hydroxyethyl bacteriochlorophyllide A dehydrogenase n=1 Tax=Mesorhizobium robiniae TaxID=559315 RepID=A0ABV2GFV9_9HYPH
MRAAYYIGNKNFQIEPGNAVPPGAGEVRIDVAYCGICGTDLHVYHGAMDRRVGDHRIIGHEMSGVVGALGDGITSLAVGERVVVRPLGSCGECPACKAGHDHICHKLKFLGLDSDGAMQTSWTVPAALVHRVGPSMDLRHAALVEPVAVACHDVRRGRVSPGEDVLVVGFGPIGMLVALVARHTGANVRVAEVNEDRSRIAATLGFPVCNPQTTSSEALLETTGGKGFDVVFEVAGVQQATDLAVAVAAARGRVVMVAIHSKPAQIDLFRFFWREVELIGARVYRPEDFDEAIHLLGDGTIPANLIITETVDLDYIADAFAGAHKGMKTILAIGEQS